MNIIKELFKDRSFIKKTLAIAVPVTAQNLLSNMLNLIENRLQGASNIGSNGISELTEICDILDVMNIPDDGTQVIIDTTIARGLAYYTGTVFECWLTELPAYGAVFSGGRYDGLVNRFSEQTLPAVGASIGIDRLLAALIEIGNAALLEKLAYRKATADVLILPVFGVTNSQAFALAQKYRDAGIKTEVYVGKEKQPKKMFSYADATGVRFAVIVGPDEMEKGEVSVKDLEAGRIVASDISDRDEYLKQRTAQKSMSVDDSIRYILSELKTNSSLE